MTAQESPPRSPPPGDQHGSLDRRDVIAMPPAVRPPRSTGAYSDNPVRRWTINGDFFGLRSTGIARYAREVTLALDALFEEGHPFTQGLALDLVAPRAAADPLALRHISISFLPELRPRLPQVWVQWQLPRQVPGGLLSFCNLAPIWARKHIVCIHDLQTRTTPESYGRLFRVMHRLILPSLVGHADFVTTVSAFSKSTFLDFGLASPEKIVVIHNGGDHALRWHRDLALRSWSKDRPFVLCIGRNEAHKNMRLIWRIASRLDALGIDVVAVGNFDAASLDRLGGGRPANLRCIGHVSDDELARGFAEALCFIFPSRTEGFGLPAIEAMVCGCPVIASLTSCMTEICGTAALFVDPDDDEGWVTTVSRLLKQPDLVDTLRRDGHVRSGRYAWREAALSYLRLMLHIDERQEHPSNPAASIERNDRRKLA